MNETQRAVVVYCASSSLVDKCYFEAAARLGELLAEKNIICINGAGKQGLMGALNDSVIRHGGTVKGIIPRFMVDAGWCHERLNETIITQTIHERKEYMARAADAVVALPGGVGTLEELAEIVTWKQLGLYGNPVIILNTNDYYRPLLSFFEKMIEEKFLKTTDRNMWIVASTPEEVITLLANSSHWMPSGALDQQKVL
ncbi:MAG: Rossman fold protein, TIGR00730 family [Bacteroidetes bacterium GWD2_45_23]|nr:MAG: Rossman fold protein, TIGR00730 family [Bacteroidetes bacterium GWC2_46_850]OFX74803.1 MAG: Rossman fold protein, TIGR00730 family [Bacteroidetes bacterium GWC1_47_7]OFX87345.1 MAG: Rossman fold protein, TIGR00730 family [Bacteroidetes bacterium GWD2_45_23]HAR39635.1 TIGR00730 family Rossman fold protein [Porphyromonadaceae bacterium]HBB01615.1 TIGR00730 family Rossman fold protein [Porphyromonadaceae bacterium]